MLSGDRHGCYYVIAMNVIERSPCVGIRISSLSPKNKLLGHYIRQHWRIENSQHYILDVVLREDASRIVMEDAVEHMALFRRFVLNILKQSNCGAPSQRNKLKKAGWNDDYRAQLFFG
ncbi:ISAs1 family transposase [Aeromonas allosaccharophila]|uniref:ISAs1 family transposase n=1 Tax=Aeromonas allosaccharophila TaxID=656 RepID=UPI003D20E07B